MRTMAVYLRGSFLADLTQPESACFLRRLFYCPDGRKGRSKMQFFMSSKINLVLLGFVVVLLVGGGSAKADFISGYPAEIGTQVRGTLVAWGLNDDGQCNVPRGNDFVAISGGHWHSLALRVNGSLV